MTDLLAREVLKERVDLGCSLVRSIYIHVYSLRFVRPRGQTNEIDLPSKDTAIDAGFGNRESTCVQDVVVGESINELRWPQVRHYSIARHDLEILCRKRHTSALDPPVLRPRR